jgi:hypothetical protein
MRARAGIGGWLLDDHHVAGQARGARQTLAHGQGGLQACACVVQRAGGRPEHQPVVQLDPDQGQTSGTSSAAARLAAASTSPNPSDVVIARATRGRRPRSSDMLALAIVAQQPHRSAPRRQDDIRRPV